MISCSRRIDWRWGRGRRIRWRRIERRRLGALLRRLEPLDHTLSEHEDEQDDRINQAAADADRNADRPADFFGFRRRRRSESILNERHHEGKESPDTPVDDTP